MTIATNWSSDQRPTKSRRPSPFRKVSPQRSKWPQLRLCCRQFIQMLQLNAEQTEGNDVLRGKFDALDEV